jgi:F0F1-type ATP synthase assembly protein I
MPEQEDKQSNISTYMRYSGMALEFFLICGVAAFIGTKLDKWLKLSFPAFTIILLLIAMSGALYRIYKQTTKS